MATSFHQTSRSLSADSPRFYHVAWLLAAGCIAVWMGWFFLGSVTVFEVSSQAHLEVKRAPHFLDALVPSQVVTMHLSLGQSVKAGDLLMELDASNEKLKLRQEQAHLASLDGRIASLKLEILSREKARAEQLQSTLAEAESGRHRIEEATIKVDDATGQQSRIRQLASKGGIAKVDQIKAESETRKLVVTRAALLADIRRMEMAARAAADTAEAEIEALRSTAMLYDGERETSVAAIERLKLDIEKHVVRAPIDGTLGDVIPTKVGAYVAEGQRLATIIPDGELMIIGAFSPSPTLGRVKAGQVARLRLDSYPWAQYGTVEARVTGVASEIRNNLVDVEFSITSVPDTGIVLQHGLPGDIEVAVEDASPASLALRSAGFLLGGKHTPSQQVAGINP